MSTLHPLGSSMALVDAIKGYGDKYGDCDQLLSDFLLFDVWHLEVFYSFSAASHTILTPRIQPFPDLSFHQLRSERFYQIQQKFYNFTKKFSQLFTLLIALTSMLDTCIILQCFPLCHYQNIPYMLLHLT